MYRAEKEKDGEGNRESTVRILGEGIDQQDIENEVAPCVKRLVQHSPESLSEPRQDLTQYGSIPRQRFVY